MDIVFSFFYKKKKITKKKLQENFLQKNIFYKKIFLHGPHFLKKNKKIFFLKTNSTRARHFHASSPQLASAQVGCKSRLRRRGPHIGWPVV